MRITKKALDALPTVRLYFTKKKYHTVPYKNAKKPVNLPLALSDFKLNGKGLPWGCGVSTAGLRQPELFDHPVHYIYTIGSVVYIVVMETEGGQPKLAIRYCHRGSPLIQAYDKSRKSPAMWRKFKKLLAEHPVLKLENGRSESGKGAHSPGAASGHRHPTAPHGDKNKAGLQGALRRAQQAGYYPEGLTA